MSDVRRDGIAIVMLILAALAAAAPLWGPGMVNTRGGGDSPFLLLRTHQMLVNLRAGVFPVRWMPDAAYGLGYPFFSYYSAFPYYLAGLLALVGLDLLTALKLVQTLGFVTAALAMYGWTREITGNRWAAWLAAVAYTVAPFHLVNVYVRGDSLSEFYAFVFYPLILWALSKLARVVTADNAIPMAHRAAGVERPNLCAVICSAPFACAALAYAGLILTHNISAFNFSPFVLLYALVLALRAPDRRRYVLVAGVLALGVGLLLSAWVWGPTLVERSAVQTETLTGGYFHHTRHFRTTDLVQSRLLFNYSTVEMDTPFAMGLLQAIFAALGVLVLTARWLRASLPGPPDARERDLRARWGFVLFGLVASTVMITPLSKLLWDYVPLLPMTQFPWRFLSVQALFAAAATAALVPNRCAIRMAPSKRGRRATSTRRFSIANVRPVHVALPVALLLALSVLLPLQPERLPVGPADVTPQRLQLYELFTQNIGTTIGYEWLPRAVVPRPYTSAALVEHDDAPEAIPLRGASLRAALVERDPTRQVWRVWGEGGGLAFPILYWPGWRAWVDGEPVDVGPVDGSGYLALAAPPGEHIVLLKLGRTPVRIVTEVISLCALVVLIAGLLRAQRTSPWIRWSRIAGTVVSVVLPLLLFMLLPRGAFGGESDLTMDFNLMPYLHHNPGGVDFGDGTLTGYRLSAEELAPGDALTVTLDWMCPTDAYTATVRLFAPAAVRQELEPLAEASCNLLPEASNVATLRLPEEMSRGTYLLQLSVFGPAREDEAVVPYRALTPGGRMRGPLYLRPVRVPRGSSLPADSSVLAPFGPAIRLYRATVDQRDPHRLAVRLVWSTTQPVASNYGISLRLLDPDGERRVALDTQPGYGFFPTSMWRPGELIVDRYTLDLPQDLAPSDDHQLVVILYQVSTWETIGKATLGPFALPLEGVFEARRPPRKFSLPPLDHSLTVDFGQEVQLAGYDLDREADALHLTLWWRALRSPRADYTVFVHLFDPATEDIVAQSDAMPQVGTYPTSWWVAGEVVSETVTLSLREVPSGRYRLGVGLYHPPSTRLQAVGPDGQPLPDARVILPENVERNR